MRSVLQVERIMSRPRLYLEDAKSVRGHLRLATAISNQIHEQENRLIHLLAIIDEGRYFVRYGVHSLRGYCVHDLGFSRTQAQRIVTAVRRFRMDRVADAKPPEQAREHAFPELHVGTPYQRATLSKRPRRRISD